VDNTLGLARAAHYAACTGLFGLCLFRLYASSLGWSVRLASALAITALLSGLIWFVLVTRDLAGTVDATALLTLTTQTSFGMVWTARMALSLAVVAVAASRKLPEQLLLALSGALLTSIALTGHTQVHAGWLGVAHVGADLMHLTCAGVWLGGLIGLTLILRRAQPSQTLARDVEAFSRIVQVAVAGLVISGLANAAILIGGFGGLFTSQYGRQLLVKLAFFAGMIVLALVNRFALTPKLAGSEKSVRALRRNVLIEQGLAVLVLLSVGWLGMSEPPG
jgi:putative copper resistance protein D